MSPFFELEFKPIYKPGDTVQIAGEAYKVKEVRQAFPFRYKATNVTADTTVDLKEQGLKGRTGELLHVRIRNLGPCTFTYRVEGAGGPVVGSYAGAERSADEDTMANLLEAFIFEDKCGWLYVAAKPIVSPAWFQIKAEGYLYIVEKTAEKAVSYPPYISEKR